MSRKADKMITMPNRPIYYKYRSFDNFKFFIDILLNNRLYAAKYNELNDIREGIYSHDGTLEKDIISDIKNDKVNLRICSLSKSNNIQPMWAHYANNHKGIAIGIKLSNDKYSIENVDYSGIKRDVSSANIHDESIAKKILSCKETEWRYEKEVRIFTKVNDSNDTGYIDIEIVEIILGAYILENDRDILNQIIDRIGLNIRIIEYKDVMQKRIHQRNNK